MEFLIKGARVIDPGNLDGRADILIKDGIICQVVLGEESVAPDSKGRFRIIDAFGKIAVPGLIDMHVHLREPGQEHKETIRSGCAAAAHGGVTSVCAMPNTDPVNDDPRVTGFILEKARQAKSVRVYPVAAITRGLCGEELCEYRKLKDAGAVALSDDGRPVMNSRLMRNALEAAKEAGLPVISHCEDIHLAEGGLMNEGAVAARMGFTGIPNVAESIMVERDISLSELTGQPVHIAHVSTMESVRAVRTAKERGVPVTAETAPHYFTLTHEAVELYGTNAKMNPPLRGERDRDAVIEGLMDGTIDVIATDHAPHSIVEKNMDFRDAPNGIIGLETSLSLSLRLVQEGLLTWVQLVEKMSKNPARILGIETGLNAGRPADITIIDPQRRYMMNVDSFMSMGRNTPFHGWNATGKAVMTVVGGMIVYRDRQFTGESTG